MLSRFRFIVFLLLISSGSLLFAAHLNHNNTGQVAILPLYTVNNDFITNFTVTNTSDRYKVVRVRLLDSKISADILDINLYLSPHDVWNATLRMNPSNGLPNLITEDESCTYPLKTELQAGKDLQNRYSAISIEDFTLGYVEIIEIGDIADGDGPALDSGMEAEIDVSGVADGGVDSLAGDRSIPQGLWHSSSEPADCSVVSDAWAAGAESASVVNGFEPGSMSSEGVAEDSGSSNAPYEDSHNAGLVAPSGGISVFGIMINVATGTAFVEQATHIDRYTSVAQHYLPDDPVHYRLPSLASGNIQEAHIPNAQGDGMQSDTMPLSEYDTGALQDISPMPSVPMGSNPLPIATILSVSTLSAPYFVDKSVNGLTDIVLTFPMRKHGIYNGGSLTNNLNTNITACVGSLDDGVDDGGEVMIDSLNTMVDDYPHDGAGGLCSNAGFETDYRAEPVSRILYYDYEDGESGMWDTSQDFGIQPVTAGEYRFRGSVNVRGVNQSSSSLFGPPFGSGYDNLWLMEYGAEAGWLSINFLDYYNYERNPPIRLLTEVSGGLGATVENTWTGFPVIGFSAMVSELNSNQLGEVVELIRRIDR
ncbi:MAG: hypothetical protein ABW105_15955 [Candidatus Thiodiazotropha sp. 6PLUC1]